MPDENQSEQIRTVHLVLGDGAAVGDHHGPTPPALSPEQERLLSALLAALRARQAAQQEAE